MTITLTVSDRDAVVHVLEVAVQGVLMEALRDADVGVAAICGGALSCATCHVYIDQDHISRVPPAESDERELLSELQHRRDNSRLACQVQMSEPLDGLRLTIAPEE